MKKIIYVIAFTLALTSCKKETPKDFVTLSGTIIDQNSDSILLLSRGFKKRIAVAEDGTFTDTLKVVPGKYFLYDGAEQAALYLKNGYDLQISLDTKEFDETIGYKGRGAEANNYLAKKALLNEKMFLDASLFDLDKEKFLKKTTQIKDELGNLLQDRTGLDKSFVTSEEKEAESLIDRLHTSYEDHQYILLNLAKGKASPRFVDYENSNGGNMSLSDLEGKYVYIDLWATWCGPCKVEIPFLRALEKEYHANENIAFVSISVDRQKDYGTWKKMVSDVASNSIQLYAKEDKEFMDAYRVTGIPRFILIDPSGKIVDSDAPRPSSDDLKILLNTLPI